MADYIRRLVSGQKARFKDEELKLELDLVYVTDQIIIMGYPASGFEGYYRNKREDVQKFLNHRHGKNYWIYNFCPLGENSYEASEFDGRVSRYPFPDHHAPPLAIMPLVAREMREWLDGSPERVAVLHCKAGKGRSGTMACAYLLSLDEKPTPPKLKRSYTAREWAKRRADDTMNALPVESEQDRIAPSLIQISPSHTSESDTSNILDPEETGGSAFSKSPVSMSPAQANPERSFTDALKGVLDLHTTRRMKAPSDSLKKQKQGVSIASQRRFLNYWALCLAHEAPPGFWSLTPRLASVDSANTCPRKQVKLTEVKLRLRELSSVKLGLVKAANIIIDKARGGGTTTTRPITCQEASTLDDRSSPNGNANHIWVSLARYDDEFVNTLEQWEKHTRDEQGNMGIRKPGSDQRAAEEHPEEHIAAMFHDGRWDKHKMVRRFARLGEVGEATRTESRGIDKDEKILTYTLRPLSHKRWQGIKKDIQNNSGHQSEQVKTQAYDLPADEALSLSDAESQLNSRAADTGNAIREDNSDSGIILGAEREVRIKLYMGQVFMGWIWLIPAFHIPHTSTQNGNKDDSTPTRTTIYLTRKEVDFPVGLGTGIVDVEISLESLASASHNKKGLVTVPGKSDEAFPQLGVDDQYAK